MQVHLTRYPGADGNAEMLTMLERMRSRLAKSYYQKAVYYETLEDKPRSAYVAYQSLLEEFPNSEWTEIANGRIKELRQSLGLSEDN